MPPRIPEEKRAEILADIERRDGRSTRQIGAAHGVSDRLVRKIAEENGITDAWSREHTENATRARLADLAERRSILAAGLLDDAEALRERAWNEYEQAISTGEGLAYATFDLPPLDQVRNAYTSLGIATDKHLALVKHDADPGTERTRSLLAGLGDAFQIAAAALDSDDDPGDDEPDSGNAAPQP